MGVWRDLFGPSREAVGLLVTDPTAPIRSPWTSTQLRRVIVSELAGVESAEVSRSDAVRIPAVSRGRGLICGTLARHPLTLHRYTDGGDGGHASAGEQVPTPAWLTSTNTRQSPSSRVLWTLDDLLFSGLSVWAVERDADNAITDAVRVSPAYWSIDPDSLGVIVNGKLADDDEVIVFEGPQDGLLTIADDAIRASRNLANAWQQRVKAPIPLTAIRQTDPNAQLTDDEVDDLIIDWESARANGGTAFIPPGFDVDALGAGQAPDLYVEGRNAERIDWANFIGLPAAMLDGSMSTATLTYSTQEGKRSEFVDYSLNYWAQPIEARLSQDDITPEGTFCRFDIRWLTNPEQGGSNPPMED